ncbi:hypothetical protein BF95_06285 [Sphingobium sp. Ant17]|nr:hypothetical protein BF95_06285 [Sphingobium sp. Ant17]
MNIMPKILAAIRRVFEDIVVMRDNPPDANHMAGVGIGLFVAHVVAGAGLPVRSANVLAFPKTIMFRNGRDR